LLGVSAGATRVALDGFADTCYLTSVP